MKIYPTIITLFFILNASAQKVKLGLNLQKGTTYHHTSTGSVAIGETINGQAININTTISGKMDFKVTDVKDGVFYTQADYTEIGMKMQIPGQNEMTFQSNVKQKTDIMSQMLSQMTGKTFSVAFNQNGKIQSLQGIENLMTGMFDKFPQIPEAQKAQIKSQLMQSFGNTAFKGNIEMETAIFPEAPVDKNGKWVIHTVLNSTMQADIQTNFQLTAVTDTYYAIHGDGVITTKDNDTYAKLNGMDIKYVMNGTMTSDIKVDKATGWITESNITEAIKGNAIIKDNPQVPGGMTMPMTIDSRINTVGN